MAVGPLLYYSVDLTVQQDSILVCPELSFIIYVSFCHQTPLLMLVPFGIVVFHKDKTLNYLKKAMIPYTSLNYYMIRYATLQYNSINFIA